VKLMTDTPNNDTAKRITDQIKAHPGIALASGVVLGALASALLPKGAARRIAKGAVAAATVGTEAGMVLARQARERAQAAADDAAEHLHAAEDKAGAGIRRIGRSAAHAAGSTSSAGLDLARTAIRLLGSLRR
jgi:hypothetical protein